MNAPNDPRFRVTMQQPPMSDESFRSPRKVCVLRRAMPGNPAANAQWNIWRNLWIGNWAWKKVLADSSMFWIMTTNGVARMKVDNDDFLVTAPTQADLDILPAPLKA